MTDKNKITVKIGHIEYILRGFESEEYIQRVAIYVNRKMEEIEHIQPDLNEIRLAVLTSINIADDAIKLKDENDGLIREINYYRKKFMQNDNRLKQHE